MRDLLAYLLYGIIAALGIFGAFEIYERVTSTTNVDDFKAQVAQFKAGMNRNYQRAPGRYGTTAFTDANLITMGIAPESTQLNSTTLTNPWNGASDVSGNNSMYWNYDNDNIPKTDCIAILKQFTSAMGIVQFKVSSTIAGVAAAGAVLPESADATIIGACNNDLNGIRLVIQ